MASVGVRELRQRASELLRRVQAGETIQVTDRGRPVAVLAPLPDTGPLERLRAAGIVTAATLDVADLAPPLPLPEATPSPSAVLASCAPMSADGATYVDSSAIVKLAVREPESAALAGGGRWMGSPGQQRSRQDPGPARAPPLGPRGAGTRIDDAAERVPRRGDRRDPRRRRRAATTGDRSLYAIHLATAAALGRDLDRLCTYDLRMAAAARAAGITVLAPR